MKKMRYVLMLPLLLLLVAAGVAFCGKGASGANIPATDGLHKVTNSVYYWRTVFKLSEAESEFLEKNDVGRIYLRMFDVTCNSDDAAVPNATIRFGQSVPQDVEIVPAVFITYSALACQDDDGIKSLAERIVRRVEHICSWNGITCWNELQLDYDWTDNTRNKFFALCREVKKILPEGMLLSSTIRLHQLREDAPPVDYGVLMVYNTDDFRDPRATNSILNDTTVANYLTSRIDFNLPLDIALPVYQWNLIFGKDGKFRRIQDGWGCEDDEVTKFESVPFDVLQRTQSILNEYLHLEGNRHSTVLYHLDEKNISNYSDEQFKNLYNN